MVLFQIQIQANKSGFGGAWAESDGFLIKFGYKSCDLASEACGHKVMVVSPNLTINLASDAPGQKVMVF